MSETDSKFKQRIVGALVLVALAIIFVPMLFSSKEEHPLPRVDVQVPPPPVVAPVPDIRVEPVEVPVPVEDLYEPVVEPEPEFVLIEHEPVAEPVVPVAPQPQVVEPPVAKPEPARPPVAETRPAQPVTPPPAVKPEPVAKPVPKPAAPGIDRNNLPVSWSIQLASLASLDNAERLRDTFRAKHYTAYIRSGDGVHKVLIGPLIREAEAVATCKQLKARENQDCFVVRYQP
ncbi:MAG: SPOR domain-containing protein [Gammaproteobacteria bacterium]|nr:SPOR domain-containing protein [Gammaproteobacteria bacterium]